MYRLTRVLAGLGLLLLATTAQALVLNFEAPLGLTGAQEVGPVPTAATGTGDLTYDSLLRSLFVNMTWSGLAAPPTASHVHVGNGPGTTGGVALPFFGFPAATSGTYSSIVDLSNPTVYSTTFRALHGGTADGAEAALLAALQEGRAYLNIHNSVWPAGEIRGDLVQVNPVPEPAGVLLVGLGSAVVFAACRRRRAARSNVAISR